MISGTMAAYNVVTTVITNSSSKAPYYNYTEITLYFSLSPSWLGIRINFWSNFFNVQLFSIKLLFFPGTKFPPLTHRMEDQALMRLLQSSYTRSRGTERGREERGISPLHSYYQEFLCVKTHKWPHQGSAGKVDR